jgi:hypothetical protein
MVKPRTPITNEELAGLIMAVMEEANGAGWSWHYRILDNGSLVLQLQKAGSWFAMKNDNGSGPHLVINDVTAGSADKEDVTAESEDDLPPGWRDES